MIVTYHGKQFFKLQQGDFTLAYNPISKEVAGAKATRFGSTITLVSLRHPNYNGVDLTSYGDATPFIIHGPGSYEVGGITINGFATKGVVDGKEYVNTIYFVVIDGVNYCFIGDLADPGIDQGIKEFIESVDVLFVPIGGGSTLTPTQAAKLSKVWSPKVIIPMDYGSGRDAGTLDAFVKEAGSHTDPVDKFVFKPSDLDKLSGHVVVINEQ